VDYRGSVYMYFDRPSHLLVPISYGIRDLVGREVNIPSLLQSSNTLANAQPPPNRAGAPSWSEASVRLRKRAALAASVCFRARTNRQVACSPEACSAPNALLDFSFSL